MTYKFGDNDATYRRAMKLAPQLIAQANASATAESLEVKSEHAAVFYIEYGWWRFTTRTAEAFLRLIEGGFTVEALPLMRNIIDHTYSMIWLADAGEEGLLALEQHTHDLRKKLLFHLDRTGWEITDAPGLMPSPELPAEGTPERKRYDRLRGELGNFADLVAAFGTPDMYPVYQHLSDYTHSGAYTANAYLHKADDGTVYLRPDAKARSRADVIWATVCLIQAGKVVDEMLAGNPFRKLLDQAVRDLGLPPGYLPARIIGERANRRSDLG